MFCMWIIANAQYSKTCLWNASYSTAVPLFRVYIAMFNCSHYCFLLKHEATGCLHCRESPQAHTKNQVITCTEHYLNFYLGVLCRSFLSGNTFLKIIANKMATPMVASTGNNPMCAILTPLRLNIVFYLCHLYCLALHKCFLLLLAGCPHSQSSLPDNSLVPVSGFESLHSELDKEASMAENYDFQISLYVEVLFQPAQFTDQAPCVVV